MKKGTIIAFVLAPVLVVAGVLLSWDQVSEAESYKLYLGTNSGRYTAELATPSLQVTLADPLVRTFYAVTAVNSNGLESDFSKEVFSPPILTLSVEQSPNVTGKWATLSYPAPATLSNVMGTAFFRLRIDRTDQ